MGLDMPRFERILIVPHVRKPAMGETVQKVGTWLEAHGATYFLLPDDVAALELNLPGVTLADVEPPDLAVVLGGDGTMLRAVDILWEADVPLLGINIGKMGFLTAAEAHQAEQALSDVFNGKFRVSERMPVGCTLEAGGARRAFHALNEIVIGKLVQERLIHLSTYINGEFFMRYSGDGLIFASSTGSTAYSLSAGGPIVTPRANCLLLTPICAHMLFSRPMVLDSGDRVRVSVEGDPERLSLSVDGRVDVEVPHGSSIEFYGLGERVKILEFTGATFYGTVRRKFLSPPVCDDIQ